MSNSKGFHVDGGFGFTKDCFGLVLTQSRSTTSTRSHPPPKYEEIVKYDNELLEEINVLTTLKPYNKLRRINGKISIDTRMSCLRIITKDSRQTALEDLRRILTHINKNDVNTKDVIRTAFDILITTTYKKDSKWIQKANELLKEDQLYNSK